MHHSTPRTSRARFLRTIRTNCTANTNHNYSPCNVPRKHGEAHQIWRQSPRRRRLHASAALCGLSTLKMIISLGLTGLANTLVPCACTILAQRSYSNAWAIMWCVWLARSLYRNAHSFVTAMFEMKTVLLFGHS